MTKRTSVGLIYLGVVFMTLVLRISSSLDIYSAIGVRDSDAFFTLVVQLLIFGALPFGLYFFTVSAKRGEGLPGTFRDFGFRRISLKNCLRLVPITVCTMIVASAVSYFWQAVLQFVGFTHISSSVDYSGVDVLFKELALTALLPAVFEELTHRGLIYAGYKELGWRYVVVSATLFALMHQNIVQTGYTMFDGAIMATVMLYTGSVYPGIIMHFVNNGFSVISGYAAQNGGALAFIPMIENWLSGSIAGIAVQVVAVTVSAVLLALLLIGMRREAVKFCRLDERPFYVPSVDPPRPLYKDPIYLVTVFLGVAATIFSFVWGVLR